MWFSLMRQSKLRLTAKLLAAAVMIAVLFTFSATEVEFVYTGF